MKNINIFKDDKTFILSNYVLFLLGVLLPILPFVAFLLALFKQKDLIDGLAKNHIVWQINSFVYSFAFFGLLFVVFGRFIGSAVFPISMTFFMLLYGLGLGLFFKKRTCEINKVFMVS